MALFHHFRRTCLGAALCTIFFTGILLQPLSAAGMTRVIPVIGGSRIYTDLPSAKNAAVAECLLSAVETAALDLLPVQRLEENFPAVSDMLSSRRNEFIRDYKILREVKTENHFRVLVQVTVDLDRLAEGLSSAGAAVTPEEMPRILFLISEKDADDISFQYWWRKGKPLFMSDSAARPMKRILYEKGFGVIDPEQISSDFFDDLKLNAVLTDNEAVLLGLRLNADVVICGRAVAEETSNRMGEDIRSFKSTLDVNAIVTATGERIAPIRTSAIAADRDASLGSRQALSDAGEQAGIILASRILSKWHALKETAGEIRLNIRGAEGLPALVAFRNALKDIPGVTAQQTIEMTPDSAVLSVQYRYTPQTLADALVLKTFTDFGINIYEIGEDFLSIEFVSRQPVMRSP